MTHIPESVSRTLDWAAALTAVATLAQFLPALAAVLTIIWTGIRIYDRLRHGHARSD